MLEKQSITEDQILVRIILITEAMDHAKHPPLCAVVYTKGLLDQTQPSAVNSEERPSNQTMSSSLEWSIV